MPKVPLHFLITAGPTREALDPVRYLTNHSSGRMGYALAAAARRLGHRVTLISGPVQLIPPAGVKVIQVETALQMRTATLRASKNADVTIMAAAVADYRPRNFSRQKLKKTGNRQTTTLVLVKNPDILQELGARKREGQTLVGFAAETQDVLKNAQLKLRRKNLDAIVANKVGGTRSGFQSEFNIATLITNTGTKIGFQRMLKTRLSEKLIREIIKLSSPFKNSGAWRDE
jgi:phosphopantothenoylcysteine decarboxylase / phosphopantothenate---cysteine ligase